MKSYVKLIIAVVIVLLAGALAYFIITFRYGLAHYNSREFPVPIQRQHKSWPEIFNKGTAMEFAAFKSGYAVAQPNARPYLNLESLPEGFDISRKEISPIYSYYVKHPRRGDILIDAGLDGSFYKNPPAGSLHFMLKGYQDSTKTHYRQEKDQNIKYWIDKHKLNPRMVLLTHLHPDHVCGLLELDDSIQVIFGKNEDSFYYRAIAGKYLGDKDLYTLDFSKSVSIRPFSKAIDLFGDNTVYALSTPGHTIDHISYIINIKDNPVLLVGDLSVSKDYLLGNIESSIDDKKNGIEQLRKSLDEIKEFKRMYPRVKIYFTHSDGYY